MALITLVSVKAKLGIATTDTSRDEQISALLAGAQSHVETATCRYEVGDTATVEIYDGTGGEELLLKTPWTVIDDDHPFELRVDSARVFGHDTIVDPDDYDAGATDEAFGVIFYEGSFPTTKRSVRVSRFPGFLAADYPADLLDVMAELCALMANRANAAGLSTQSIGQWSESYAQLESAHLSLKSKMALENHAPPPEAM